MASGENVDNEVCSMGTMRRGTQIPSVYMIDFMKEGGGSVARPPPVHPQNDKHQLFQLIIIKSVIFPLIIISHTKHNCL